MKLTTEQHEHIKQLQDSGVSNSIIAAYYKTNYNTFMKRLRDYERDNTE